MDDAKQSRKAGESPRYASSNSPDDERSQWSMIRLAVYAAKLIMYYASVLAITCAECTIICLIRAKEKEYGVVWDNV